VTTAQVIELVAAAAIAAGGVWLYRRRSAEADAQYGSQGAVILFVIAAILMIHGLGWLEYHPSAAELGQ
jgi:hypothetical protein